MGVTGVWATVILCWFCMIYAAETINFYPGIYADKSRYATTDAAILKFA